MDDFFCNGVEGRDYITFYLGLKPTFLKGYSKLFIYKSKNLSIELLLLLGKRSLKGLDLLCDLLLKSYRII